MTENNDTPKGNKPPDWFDNLPGWAQLLIGGGVLVGGVMLAQQANEIEEAQRQRRMQAYANRAEEEVSELISMEYSEVISILRDSIPRMDAEYWKFFEGRLSASATSYKVRNVLERAREIRGSTTDSSHG